MRRVMEPFQARLICDIMSHGPTGKGAVSSPDMTSAGCKAPP